MNIPSCQNIIQAPLPVQSQYSTKTTNCFGFLWYSSYLPSVRPTNSVNSPLFIGSLRFFCKILGLSIEGGKHCALLAMYEFCNNSSLLRRIHKMLLFQISSQYGVICKGVIYKESMKRCFGINHQPIKETKY